MNRILLLVIIKKFYERNTGFFFFIFFLMFGIVESTQIVNYHLSLIYGMISAPVFLALVCFLWALYMTKCIAFFQQALALPENSFLRQISLSNPGRQMRLIAYSVIFMYVPVLLYSILIVSIALQTHHFLVAVIIIGFHASLIVAGTAYIFFHLNSVRPPLITFPSFHWSWAKPFPFFYLSLLTSRLKIILFVTKIFSVLSILLFLQISLDHYEYRTALLGLLFGLAAHTVITFEFRKLEDQNLFFIRGLPFSIGQRFLHLALTYALLLLPEIVTIVVNQIRIIDALSIFIAGLSFLLFTHCSLYSRRPNMDEHMQTILWVFLLGFGLTLFKLSLPASVFLLVLSLVRYRKNYYLYEASAEE